MAYIPSTHRALVVTAYGSTPPTVQERPLPTSQPPPPGSALVRIVNSGVISYASEVYITRKRPYPYPLPIVPGASAIARIVSLGPDATGTFLKPDQLVWVNCFVKGRDDPSAAILQGVTEGFTEGSRKLMHNEWRDGTLAEYSKVPLENCFALDEARLCGALSSSGLGYSAAQLSYISTLLVPYGGLRDIALQAGETVIVAPATGSFGAAAVHVALSMGARVIAMGRNVAKLDKLKTMHSSNPTFKGRVEVVPITGDIEQEATALRQAAGGPIDAYFDISPPEATHSTHIKSAINTLRHSGRVSLMGGLSGDLSVPYTSIMHRDIQLKGKWMYEREDIVALIQMVKVGVLRLDNVEVVGEFGLEEWEKAFEVAAQHTDAGQVVVISP